MTYVIAGVIPEEYEIEKTQRVKGEVWTIEYLIDEVFLSLMNRKEVFCLINGNRPVSKFNEGKESVRCNSGRGVLRGKYAEQARYKMYRMPVFRPAPPFVISLRDLDNRVKEELLKEDVDTRKFVLKQAVERIFEVIDKRYYVLSAKPFLKVRLER